MSNVEFIKNWFLENNFYLKDNPDKDEILNILIMNAIAFETLEFKNINDSIMVNNDYIAFKSGNVINNEQVEKILKIINIEYAYLEVEELLNTGAYSLIKDDNLTKVLEYDDIITYFEGIYNMLKQQYIDYNFDKLAYKINNKVFFSTEKLNEEEIKYLLTIDDDNQKLFEVFHNENGELGVY